jgi:hypothetical protein
VLLPRVDYVGRLSLVTDAKAEPSPGHVPAEITPEGYLDAWALTARDGLLTYSDGLRSWQEYRPREELEATLEAWAHVPVTDGHPPEMVSARTWAQYAKGHALGEPEIVELDGVAYIRKRLRFADASLVEKIKRGDQVELSIGFLSDVVATDDYGGDAPREAAAVQTGIVPNHDASVERGRAGPRVRVLLDGVEVPVCWPGLESGLVPSLPDPSMTENKTPKADEVGAPIEEIEVPGPDGKMHKAPSFLVAELEQLRAMAKPAAPPAPVVPDAAPAMVPPPPVKPEGMDAAEVMRRVKLERRAGRLGITDAQIDAAKTSDALEQLVDAKGHELVSERLPWAKEIAKGQRGDALAGLVEVALVAPAAQRTDANPWAPSVPAPVPQPRTDEVDAALAAFRKSQGFDS